jgi:serine/threonine protein phosphatase 1
MTGATEGQRIYAIGDVHGHLDALNDVLARIRDDLADRPHSRPRVVCMGDYMDRGPDSRGALDALISLEASPLATTFLLGNHDDFVRIYLDNPEAYDCNYHWLHPTLGGAETLASYGVRDASPVNPNATRDAFAAAFPAEHMAFLERCGLFLRVGGYLFVHAGIQPGVELERQQRSDFIWMREPFLSDRSDHGFKVVHGHSIVPEVEHHSNRIAIDTGVAKGGPLSCLVLEDDGVAVLKAEGLRDLPEGAGLGVLKTSGSVRKALRGLWPAGKGR